MIEILGPICEGVFWVALAICAYSYVGYPLALGVLARLFARPHQTGPAQPSVSLLIPAHNEAKVIACKIENSLALDYPLDLLQIRVISDGSDDGTDETIQRYTPSGVEYQRVWPRGGKPNAVNQAIPHARGEILVLCDANTMFAPQALLRLVRHFADPTVGAVSGDVRLQSQTVNYGRGEGIFWKIERYAQRCESLLGSAIGVDGGMYALRLDLYVPNRSDTLIDDFVIAMNVAKAGRRVLYDPAAFASEDSVADPLQEFRRRVRTTAGGFQSLFEGRGRPRWNQAGLWAGYLSHKVLRWLGPVWLPAMLMASAALVAMAAAKGARGPTDAFYGVMLGLQVLFYLLAMAGHAARSRPLPAILSLPYYFCLANVAAAAGFFKWLLRRQSVTWAQADRNVTAATQAGIQG